MTIPLRVLILEDSPTEAELLVQHLREAGYEPDWRRVETELDYVSHLDPSLDLILVDYTLPDMSGPCALQRLRDRGWDVPAIVVTGTVSEEVALDCLRLGANDYVLKDRLARLGAAVRSALEQRDVRRERTSIAADLSRRTQQLEAVRAITLEIAHETSLVPLLSLVLQKAVELVGAASGAIYLWDEALQRLTPRVWLGCGDWMRDLRVKLGEGVSGRVAARREGMVAHAYPTSPYAHPLFTERTAIAATLAEPLLYGERLVGVIAVNHERADRRFSGWDRETLALFAGHAAIAIENARLYAVVRAHATDLEARVAERTRDLELANAKLAAASQHKSQFLANMSHEIRAPLNSILGFTQLLQEQGKAHFSEKHLRYVNNVHASGEHLLQLITDIVDLAKVEAGKFSLSLKPLAVPTVVQDILVIARGLANKKSQQIVTDVPDDLPALVADPVRLKQILFNLLSNAVKFTPDQGTIRLRVRTVRGHSEASAAGRTASGGGSSILRAPSGAPGAWLELAITDTGVGIRAEDFSRLFTEFTQLESTKAQRHEGAGLGLALTKRLVELHGGRVWAESEGEGKGSTFAVRLPLVGVAQERGV
jgi:signal transduction histidine kinase/DNA-binding response OmpR family regulator